MRKIFVELEVDVECVMVRDERVKSVDKLIDDVKSRSEATKDVVSLEVGKVKEME